jgi:hypothetical protein
MKRKAGRGERERLDKHYLVFQAASGREGAIQGKSALQKVSLWWKFRHDLDSSLATTISSITRVLDTMAGRVFMKKQFAVADASGPHGFVPFL